MHKGGLGRVSFCGLKNSPQPPLLQRGGACNIPFALAQNDEQENMKKANKNVQTILQELYLLDGEFKKHEAELIMIIQKLLASRPDVKVNKIFVKQLRAQLFEEKNSMKSRKSLSDFVKSFKIAAVGVGVAAIAFVVVVSLNSDSPTSIVSPTSTINALSSNAFGSLSQVPLAQSTGIRSQSGGGGGLGASESSFAADSSIISEKTADTFSSGLSIYPFPQYSYVYTGEEVVLSEEQVAVLRQVKSSGMSVNEQSLLAAINSDVIDLSKLKNVSIRSIDLVEDREFGLSLHWNMFDGGISIGENSDKWRSVYPCRTDDCYQENKLKIEQVPADETLIEIANTFLSEYGISTEAYGEPEVEDNWREQYARAESPERAWVPDSIQVLYPLIVDGQLVRAEYGGVVGLHVNVNIRANRASGLWNLNSGVYESSLYEAETDTERIMSIVKNGGYAGNIRYFAEPAVNAVLEDSAEETELPVIELGTPSQGFVQTWYNNGEEGSLLLVPALVFPITSKPTEGYYINQQSVIIPLVKEILDQRFKSYEKPDPDSLPLPEPVPLPVIEPAIEPKEE